MSQSAGLVRDWALAQGHTGLAEPKVEADERRAASLAALAIRITKATGFYRAPGATTTVFITFGPVTFTAADGRTSTFQITIE